MRILLTNDDGIDAPGLAALEEALGQYGGVVVVAPREALSGCSHQVNTYRPIRVERLATDRFALDATPAECVRIGLMYLAPDAELVASGINQGGNLGVDVLMSGTVAAVREAALLGRSGLAFSQFRRTREPVDWAGAMKMAARVVCELQPEPLAPGEFWNVNLPDPADRDDRPPIVHCPLDPAHLDVCYERKGDRYHYCGSYQRRPQTPGGDVEVCFSGKIAVTRMSATAGFEGVPAGT